MPCLFRPLDKTARRTPNESGDVEYMLTLPEPLVPAYVPPCGLSETAHACGVWLKNAVYRCERALTRFRAVHRAVITLMPTNDGVGCKIPETRRAVQTIIQYRVTVGGDGERNDGEVVRRAGERNLSRGGVPLFYGAVCGGGEDCIGCCPGDVPYFVAVGCVGFNVSKEGLSGQDAYALCNRGR